MKLNLQTRRVLRSWALSCLMPAAVATSAVAAEAQTPQSSEVSFDVLNMLDLDEGADEPLLILIGFKVSTQLTTGWTWDAVTRTWRTYSYYPVSVFSTYLRDSSVMDPEAIDPSWTFPGVGGHRIPRHIGTLQYPNLQTGAYPDVFGWVAIALEEDWVISRAAVTSAFNTMLIDLRNRLSAEAATIASLLPILRIPGWMELLSESMRIRMLPELYTRLQQSLNQAPFDPHDLIGVEMGAKLAGVSPYGPASHVFNNVFGSNTVLYTISGQFAPLDSSSNPGFQAPLARNEYTATYWWTDRYYLFQRLTNSSASARAGYIQNQLAAGNPVVIFFDDDNFTGSYRCFAGRRSFTGRSHLDDFGQWWNQDTTNSILFFEPGNRTDRLTVYADPNFMGPVMRLVGGAAIGGINKEFKDRFHHDLGSNGISSFSISAVAR